MTSVTNHVNFIQCLAEGPKFIIVKSGEGDSIQEAVSLEDDI